MGTKVLVEHGHVFKTDKSGEIKYIETGDNHGGPYCVTCKVYFCQHCDPEVFEEKCLDREETLPGLDYD